MPAASAVEGGDVRHPAPDPTPDPALAVILEAQAIVLRAVWRLLLDRAVDRARGRSGVVLVPLLAASDAIQVVVEDGSAVGTIHVTETGDSMVRWIAVARDVGSLGSHPSIDAAVLALLSRRRRGGWAATEDVDACAGPTHQRYGDREGGGARR